ncbi:MAG TPA: hypothetical protein VH442_04600 [Micromonosporaceae bacterium]
MVRDHGRPRRWNEPPSDIVVFGDEPGGPERPVRRWIVVALALAAVVGFIVNATLGGHSPTTRSEPTPSTHESPVNAAPPSPIGSAASSAPATPTTVRVGRPIFGITAPYELVGRGPGSVVRVDFAAGQVIRTPLPVLQSSGPIAFIVGTTWAVVRPLDRVPGYLVRDGHQAEELTGELSDGGVALPGPNGAVWVSPDVQVTRMALIGLDGTETGPSMTIPAGADGNVWPDGTGYVVAGDSHGVDLVRPNGSQRITSGSLLAVGPTRWLVQECANISCQTVAIDRSTGRGHVVAQVPAGTGGTQWITGVISPDGKVAAMRAAPDDADPAASLRLLDLSTGVQRKIDVPQPDSFYADSIAWSPDSKWLFAVADQERLVAVDAATGHVEDFGVLVPAIDQIAVRANR